MKKLLLLSIFIITLGGFHSTHASEPIKVQVTEIMPWMDCGEKGADGKYPAVGGTEENPIYECNVKPGFASVQEMLSGIIKYFTFIAGIAGVLFLIINGIMYSMGGMDPGMKDEAKKRMSKTLVGLILLFCSGIILNIIAPWIYK